MKVSEVQPGMLPKAVIDVVLAGKAVFFGEFRTGVASSFTGKGNREFKKSVCTVETAQGVISVQEFLPDNVAVADWKPPFPKGTMVYGVVRGWEESSGASVATAKLAAV